LQVHLRVSSSRILPWLISRERIKRWIFMAESTGPGPGRSTSEAAFNEVRREVARRNEEAHKAAQKRRAEKEKLRLAERRKWDRD
jgi:hypothetical protein